MRLYLRSWRPQIGAARRYEIRETPAETVASVVMDMLASLTVETTKFQIMPDALQRLLVRYKDGKKAFSSEAKHSMDTPNSSQAFKEACG